MDEDKLRALITVCKVIGCGSAIDPSEVTVRYIGTVAQVTATCNNNHSEYWESSSTVGDGHGISSYVTNILAVGCIKI